MSSKEQASSDSHRKVNQFTAFVHALVFLALFAGGFFVRGMLPSAPAGAPGGPGGPGGGAMAAPAVTTTLVKEGPAQAPKEYVGHIEAIQEVDLHAQVSGYLEGVFFEEGKWVHEGDLLFRIEQAPYKARVALSEAALAQAKAGLSSAEAELDRAHKLLKKLRSADVRSIPKTDMDSAESAVAQGDAAVAEAQAGIQQAQANLDLAKIDLGFTELRAPITGRIGKAMLTKGNYVGPASGPLAHIVQTDPVRVVTSMADRQFLDILSLSLGKDAPKYDLRLQLANGTVYPLAGIRDFEDNMMNPATGAIAVRTRFDNPDDMLIPGSYVMLHAQPADAALLPLIPQQAVLNDKEGTSVFVVGEGDVLEQRRIELGEPIDDQQVVLQGLKAGEQIVVQGLQRSKDGLKVNATLRPEK